MTCRIAPDYRSSSRRDNRRIVERRNGCRNTEDGRKDKQDGLSFDRNRLKRLPENDMPDRAGLLFVFKARQQAHRRTM